MVCITIAFNVLKTMVCIIFNILETRVCVVVFVWSAINNVFGSIIVIIVVFIWSAIENVFGFYVGKCVMYTVLDIFILVMSDATSST